jgi:hypothetical protein
MTLKYPNFVDYRILSISENRYLTGKVKPLLGTVAASGCWRPIGGWLPINLILQAGTAICHWFWYTCTNISNSLRPSFSNTFIFSNCIIPSVSYFYTVQPYIKEDRLFPSRYIYPLPRKWMPDNVHCTSTCTFVHCRKRICIQHTYTEKNPGTDPVYECKHEPISANVHPIRKQFRFLVIWKTSHATLLLKKLRLNLQLAVFCSLSVLSFKTNPKQRSDVKTVKEQTFRKTFHKRSDI